MEIVQRSGKSKFVGSDGKIKKALRIFHIFLSFASCKNLSVWPEENPYDRTPNTIEIRGSDKGRMTERKSVCIRQQQRKICVRALKYSLPHKNNILLCYGFFSRFQ